MQTPTIQLVYERQKEIKQFKPEDYYTLHIKVAGYEFDLDSQQRFKQREDLEHIVKAIAQNNIQVTTVETKRKKLSASIV